MASLPSTAAGAIAAAASSTASAVSSNRYKTPPLRTPKEKKTKLLLSIAADALERRLASLPLPFVAVAALVASSSLAPLAFHSLARLHRLLRRAIDWVLEEFEPWFKWIVLDAVLSLCVGLAAKKFKTARPALRALGWL